jgi:hypothetical protein
MLAPQGPHFRSERRLLSHVENFTSFACLQLNIHIVFAVYSCEAEIFLPAGQGGQRL